MEQRRISLFHLPPYSLDGNLLSDVSVVPIAQALANHPTLTDLMYAHILFLSPSLSHPPSACTRTRTSPMPAALRWPICCVQCPPWRHSGECGLGNIDDPLQLLSRSLGCTSITDAGVMALCAVATAHPAIKALWYACSRFFSAPLSSSLHAQARQHQRHH
jgi:hypothetical protein